MSNFIEIDNDLINLSQVSRVIFFTNAKSKNEDGAHDYKMRLVFGMSTGYTTMDIPIKENEIQYYRDKILGKNNE
jgi:hypothetical protein